MEICSFIFQCIITTLLVYQQYFENFTFIILLLNECMHVNRFFLYANHTSHTHTHYIKDLLCQCKSTSYNTLEKKILEQTFFSNRTLHLTHIIQSDHNMDALIYQSNNNNLTPSFLHYSFTHRHSQCPFSLSIYL